MWLVEESSSAGVHRAEFTARSLLTAGKFSQVLTDTFWHNWFPLCFVRVAPNHLTASHIAGEPRGCKHPSAFYITVVFFFALARQDQVARQRLCSFEVEYYPYLHHFFFTTNGVWIGVCRHPIVG